MKKSLVQPLLPLIQHQFPVAQHHFLLKDLAMKDGGNKLHKVLFSSLFSEKLFCFYFDFT